MKLMKGFILTSALVLLTGCGSSSGESKDERVKITR